MWKPMKDSNLCIKKYPHNNISPNQQPKYSSTKFVILIEKEVCKKKSSILRTGYIFMNSNSSKSLSSNFLNDM